MEKRDPFWFYIAGLILLVVVGVFIFKSREMQSVPYKAYEETQSQVEEQLKERK
jgi:hypothetical protein